MPKRPIRLKNESRTPRPDPKQMPDGFQVMMECELQPFLFRIVGDGSKTLSRKETAELLRLEKPCETVLDRMRTAVTAEERVKRSRLAVKFNKWICESVQSLYKDPHAMNAFQYRRIMQWVVPNDSYLKMLRDRIQERSPSMPSATLSTLETLQFLHLKALWKPHSIRPIEAQNAMLGAGKLGVPAPTWATDRIRGMLEGKLQNRGMNFNQELGFTARGQGNNSEIEEHLRTTVQDDSMLKIWGLLLLGKSLVDACWLEAGRRQTLCNWGTLDYDVMPNLGSTKRNADARDQELHVKRLNFSKVLEKQYYAWRTEIEDIDSEESKSLRRHLEDIREIFLSQFPSK